MNILATLVLLANLTTPTHPTTITAEIACDALLTDAIHIGMVYAKSQSEQEAAKWMVDRFERDPFYLVYLPGNLRLISVMEDVKLTSAMLVDFSVATHMVCMSENTRGWVQPIPGVIIDVLQPKPLIQKSDKVAM